MSLKDWFSSKSYRQATIKHAKNANPYLKETTIAAAAVVGIGAVACYDWFHHPKGEAYYKNSKWNKTANKIVFYKNDAYAPKLSRLSFDQILIWYSYEHTKHLVAPSILLPAAANTGIQLTISYSEGEGFSTGLSNSWKQTCNAVYGAKEIACCAGNAVGYLGTVIAVDGVYDYIISPMVGDVLHIH